MKAATLNTDFVELATPVLSEFGFGSIKELVKDQLSLMVMSKIEHYESENRMFEMKFGKPYAEFSAMNRKTGSENFEMENDLNDWRFAIESVDLYRSKLRNIQNA